MSIGISRSAVFVVAAAMLIVPGSLFAEKPPELTELAQLKMKVTAVEVKDALYDGPSDLAERNIIKADEGAKIVVVTLRGTAPRPCIATFKPTDFSCVYEEVAPGHDATKERDSVVGPAVAASFGEPWLFSLGVRTVSYYSYEKGRPVVMKIAFVVPLDVNSLLVRHVTFSAGKAVIPGKKR